MLFTWFILVEVECSPPGAITKKDSWVRVKLLCETYFSLKGTGSEEEKSSLSRVPCSGVATLAGVRRHTVWKNTSHHMLSWKEKAIVEAVYALVRRGRLVASLPKDMWWLVFNCML